MTHGGNVRMLARTTGRTENTISDFSANLNPLGPPDWLRSMISSHISSLAHYPDPECRELIEAAADRYGVTADEVVAGNGSSELLFLAARVLECTRAIIPVPSYVDYARACRLAGKEVIPFPLAEEDDFRLDLELLDSTLSGNEAVFIGQPNNPTGALCNTQELRKLAFRHPSTVFVIDEAFADFVEGLDRMTFRRPPNVMVLLSLTKSFAIPGLRLGCLVASPEIITRVRELQAPWAVNTLAQAVGAAALGDSEYLRRTREYVGRQREQLVNKLRATTNLTVFPSGANFLLVRCDREGEDAPTLSRRLLAHGIAVRVCDDFEGLGSRYFRIAVRSEEENLRLCAALSPRPASKRVRRRTPAIMFQGTGSNAGKSILTAAFCRILLQDGFRVAPFKSQNMSLNSFVTCDGGEMGRAQVVQAQACRIEPDTRMNPILLKPNSDTGSQVIVNGKPVGNMTVGEYIRFKPDAFLSAQKAFNELAEEYDVVVLEGAGSPAEVNLKSHDIVNMHMARHANAPVLLVGDIDRGGVFASFVGTMEVLAEWERSLVAGFVVNRFRGKESLLKSALDYTRNYTGKAVYGVIPYIQSLGLPEEDSVTFKSLNSGERSVAGNVVEIAIIDLPHISNFTDFDCFRIEPDVQLRIVRSPEDLGSAEVIVLPGSKNVIEDLAFLQHTGLDREILRRAGTTEIVGICGGYQMLGTGIADDHGVESSKRTMVGLGLLPVETRFSPEKTLVRAEAVHQPSGLPLHGYEIHHGQSDAVNLEPIVLRSDGCVIGAGIASTWGTYLHGIFDADEFRRWFIDRLRERRGWARVGKVCSAYNLEPAFERLAAVVREKLQVSELYRVMGLR